MALRQDDPVISNHTGATGTLVGRENKRRRASDDQIAPYQIEWEDGSVTWERRQDFEPLPRPRKPRRKSKKKEAEELASVTRTVDSPFFPGGTIDIIGPTRKEVDAVKRHIERELRKGKLGRNPMAAKKKRKATPAQLRALAKGRATAARNRKRKAPKRKKVVRRKNPAYGNYSKARSVARGSRRKNPVRKLSPLYVIKSGATYFDGARFSKQVSNAARFVNLKHTTGIARKIADATGKAVRIFDLRK